MRITGYLCNIIISETDTSPNSLRIFFATKAPLNSVCFGKISLS
jgi:hypothetical protein